MSERKYYTAFGLTIASELSLPLVKIAEAPSGVDIDISFGALPCGIDDQIANHLYTRLQSGEIVCHIPSIAKFLIRANNSITIVPDAGVSDDALELFLLGSAFGVVVHQSDGIAIHGSAVNVDGKALIFAGRSGAGKSTTATAFLSRGYELVADDLSVVRFASDGTPMVWPAYPQMKLWDTTLDMFNIDSAGLSPIMNRYTKFNRPIQEGFCKTAVPLGALFNLEVTENSALRISRLLGGAAYQAMHNNTYRVEYLKIIGDSKSHFSKCVKLVERIPVYKVQRPKSGVQPGEIVDKCLGLTQSLGEVAA